MAAIRITAVRRRAARWRSRSWCDGTFNVARGGAAGRRPEGRRRLVGLDLRAGGAVSDRRGPSSRTTTARCTARRRRCTKGCCGRSTTCTGSPYVALRYFNVYGPRMDMHGKYTEVLIRWMERLDAGQPPLILGDGSQTMDFVYVEDVARANVLALPSDVSDEVFNVGSGVGDEPQRARRGAVAGDGRARRRRATAGAQGQRGAAPAGLDREGARLLGFTASVVVRRRACAAWWPGGGRSASGWRAA